MLNIIHPRIVAYLASIPGHDDPVLRKMEAKAHREGFPIVGPPRHGAPASLDFARDTLAGGPLGHARRRRGRDVAPHEAGSFGCRGLARPSARASGFLAEESRGKARDGAPQVGSLLMVLVRSINARRVFEMGSGFGYSGLWFAKALASVGRVLSYLG